MHVKKQTLSLVDVLGNLSFCQSILSPFDLIEVGILVVAPGNMHVRERERKREREGGGKERLGPNLGWREIWLRLA